MTRRTPPMDCVGRYELQDPWIALPTKVYTCKAIRSFQDLRVKNINPYVLAYKPYGSTELAMTEDEKAGACIVSLFSDDGEVIYVPDTRIVSYPNMGDHHYRHMVLSISLGSIHDNISLDWLMAKISEDVTQAIGIDPTIKLHESPVRDVITPEQHERLEAARADKKTHQVTYKAQLEIEKAKVADLSQKYRELEKIVVENNLIKPS